MNREQREKHESTTDTPFFRWRLRRSSMNREQREKHEKGEKTMHTFAVFACFAVKIYNGHSG